jgi:hypothetical protein
MTQAPSPRASEACPRCGAPTSAGDRFCPNCGLRLPNGVTTRRKGPRAASGILVWLGPALGGFLGFYLGEAVVGELTDDAAVIVPIGVLVAFVGIVGGPALAWILNRLSPLR